VAAPSNSGALASGQDLTVQVTVSNDSSDSVESGTAQLSIGDTAFTSRSSLSDWFSDSGATSLTPRALASSPTTSLFAGESQPLTITVPAASVGLGVAGVYPITVTLVSGTTTVATSRSAIAWNPTNVNPVPVVVAAPLTVPTSADNTDFLSAAQLTKFTAPAGILTQQLGDFQQTNLAVGIDPRIIASIRVLGKSAPQSAKDWLTALEALPNETFPLQWADADLTAGLHAGLPTVLATEPLDYAINPSLFGPAPTPPTNGATPTPTPTATANPSVPSLPTSESLVAWNYTLPKLEWPAANSVVDADLPKLTASGISSIILQSTNIAPITSSAYAGASAQIGDTAVAVTDATLSDYLQTAIRASTHGEWLSSMTKLATGLDQLSVETPNGAPQMLLTLGPNWASDSLELSHSLADLYGKSWVSRGSLEQIKKATPTASKIVEKKESDFRNDRVKSMLTYEASTVAFSSAAANPQAVNSSRRLVLMSVLSNEWVAKSSAWDKASTKFNVESAAIVNSVQIVDSSAVNFLANQGSLPVTVSNKYTQAVTVLVTAKPASNQLYLEKKNSSISLTLNANEQRKALIPVHSVSNGKVIVRVTLYSSTGVQIGVTRSIEVNVHAGWETIGTLVFAALVFGIFGFGIVRNILKRRKGATEPENTQE
jgi:hypothetical protein